VFGLGTVINMAAILLGGLLGRLVGKAIPKRVQDMLYMVCGVATLFIGIGGCLEHMLMLDDGSIVTQGTMMMLISLTVGALLGEWIDLEEKLERFGQWLRNKTGNSGDATFIDAFVTASLTVCIGAMAIVGAIQDGMEGDISVLAAKSVLDFVIICVMAASMGKGCIFSLIPIGILQGSVTALSVLLKPIMTETALSNLSYVGSVLIFCVGVNLVWGKKVKVANLLPAVVIAVVWAFF
jgi:uncharacterized membrane protein YqgA involved in biofilm formation